MVLQCMKATCCTRGVFMGYYALQHAAQHSCASLLLSATIKCFVRRARAPAAAQRLLSDFTPAGSTSAGAANSIGVVYWEGVQSLRMELLHCTVAAALWQGSLSSRCCAGVAVALPSRRFAPAACDVSEYAGRAAASLAALTAAQTTWKHCLLLSVGVAWRVPTQLLSFSAVLGCGWGYACRLHVSIQWEEMLLVLRVDDVTADDSWRAVHASVHECDTQHTLCLLCSKRCGMVWNCCLGSM